MVGTSNQSVPEMASDLWGQNLVFETMNLFDQLEHNFDYAVHRRTSKDTSAKSIITVSSFFFLKIEQP